MQHKTNISFFPENCPILIVKTLSLLQCQEQRFIKNSGVLPLLLWASEPWVIKSAFPGIDNHKTHYKGSDAPASLSLSSEWQIPSLTNFCIPSHCSAKQDNQRATLSPQNMYVIKVKTTPEHVPSPSTCSIQLFLVSSSCFSLLQLQRRPLVLLCVYSP